MTRPCTRRVFPLPAEESTSFTRHMCCSLRHPGNCFLHHFVGSRPIAQLSLLPTGIQCSHESCWDLFGCLRGLNLPLTLTLSGILHPSLGFNSRKKNKSSSVMFYPSCKETTKKNGRRHLLLILREKAAAQPHRQTQNLRHGRIGTLEQHRQALGPRILGANV